MKMCPRLSPTPRHALLTVAKTSVVGVKAGKVAPVSVRNSVSWWPH